MRPAPRMTVMALALWMLLGSGIAVSTAEPEPAGAELDASLYRGRVNELYRSEHRQYLSLSGTWQLELDPDDAGEAGGWFDPAQKPFSDTVQVPGCLEGQDKGVKHLKLSPRMQPGWMANRVDKPFLKPNWWRRTFTVPADWRGRRIFLRFGGACHESKVWLNGQMLGVRRIAGLPFSFDVTEHLRLGQENVLAVRLSQIGPFGQELHHAYGLGVTLGHIHWQGIYRDVELVAVATERRLEDLQVIPQTSSGQVELRLDLAGAAQPGDACRAQILDLDGKVLNQVEVAADTPQVRCSLPATGLEFWDDEQPRLYRVRVTLLRQGRPLDSLEDRFGWRDIAFRNGQFLLNGVPVFLRGEMYHHHWPNTISPCTDRKELRALLQRYKDYGFNFLRCHTHAPHPEFLDVCDELGLLVHSEPAALSNTFPVPKEVASPLWSGVIVRDRNHPSIIIWCMGNEKKKAESEPLCDRLLAEGLSLDATRLVQSQSPGVLLNVPGRPEAPVGHEIIKSASYSDPAVKDKYRGGFRPWYIEWMEQRSRENGLDHLVPRFVRNSQLQQALTVKVGLEKIRSQQGGKPVRGYEHCMFRDGQQFLWGVVDDFGDPKAVDAPTFRNYNGATVLLLQSPDRGDRNLSVPSALSAALQVSHYGKQPIDQGRLVQELRDGDQVVARSETPIEGIACGQNWSAPKVKHQVPTFANPRRLDLVATLEWDGQSVTNRWTFWAFPASTWKPRHRVYLAEKDVPGENELRQRYPFLKTGMPADGEPAVVVCGSWSEAKAAATRGDRVLLLGDKKSLGQWQGVGIKASISGRGPRPEYKYRLGTVIDDHPALGDFPHDGWCAMQFQTSMTQPLYGVFVRAQEETRSARPIITLIPSPLDPEPQLACPVFELTVGQGTVLVCSLRYSGEDPAAGCLFDRLLGWLDR